MKSRFHIQHCSLKLALTIAVIAAAFAVTGCGQPEAPRFHLNMVAAVKNKVSPQKQQTVVDILTALYGTPDEPFLAPELRQYLDLNKVKRAAGPVSSDITGKKAGLFREHCVHCHGIGGDGMGPTAAFLKPYPRDYRPGFFKFKSTLSDLAIRPTHDDLLRVLVEGIPGSSMPSFRLLPRQDLESLVEYVKYLSIRGETELAIYRTIAEEYSGEQDEMPTDRETILNLAMEQVNKWSTAEESVIRPVTPPADFGTPESIAKGRELFFGKLANCYSCHGPTGLGDGQLKVEDVWYQALVEAQNIAKQDEKTMGQNLAIIDAFSLPKRANEPRNLRTGIYRGGRRPLDLYYRVHTGIQGSGMPGADASLPLEQKWHIVDYVLALPYEPGGNLQADANRAAFANDAY